MLLDPLMLRQILRNQVLIMESLSQILHAPGVTAHPDGTRNLHRELGKLCSETRNVVEASRSSDG